MPHTISEFLVELSSTLHKYGMYPMGHPSLQPAVAALVTHVQELLRERDQIGFGVARRQLIVGGTATDAAQPLLRRLAQTLYRHGVGAVTIHRGVEPGEFDAVLKRFASDPAQVDPTRLSLMEASRAWPHLRFQPLSFEGLSFDADGTKDGLASLWIDLARAAMAGTNVEGPGDPAHVATAIEAGCGEGYDRMIIAHLLRISRALKDSTGADAAALQRQTATLIGSLGPETMRRLVSMGGSPAEREAFIRDTTSVMAVDAVIEIIKAAADANGRTISHSLVRMLSKLAAHAEFGDEAARAHADGALRDQVGQMLDGWKLADPNPEAYGRMLERLATTDFAPRLGASIHQPDPVRLVQLSLETGDSGPLLERAIERGVSQGAAAELLTMLSSAPDPASPAAETLRDRLLLPDTLRALLERSPVDFETLDRLQPFLTIEGYEVLLDALGTADNRATRRKLLDRLVQTPFDLAPQIARRLDDHRWFVQRNMLVLLQQLGRAPEELSLTTWTAHPDIRVRHEAIRLQLTVPAERHLAVRAALEDGHPRLVHSGLAAIQHECPPGVTDLVAQIASNSAAGEDLRVLAARALGRTRDRRALPVLLALVDGGRTLFGRPKLSIRSPAMIAALQALAAGWQSDPRASILLKLASEASDPEIKQAARAVSR